jgi:hypothetical protein
MREQAFEFTGRFQGEGGKGGICWASFLVLRSGSTMPRHDLADSFCAFGQANCAAYQSWTDDVEQRRCIATTCSSSRASSPLSGVCAWCTAGGHAPFGLLLPERSLDPATPISHLEHVRSNRLLTFGLPELRPPFQEGCRGCSDVPHGLQVIAVQTENPLPNALVRQDLILEEALHDLVNRVANYAMIHE